MTIIYLDRKRSIEDNVGFSLYDLVIQSGYQINRTKTGAILPFRQQIQFLVDNNMIQFNTPISNFKGNNFASIKILDDFDSVEDYTIITADEIDTLLQSKTKIEKANLFAIYLYMKSYIFQRNLTDIGEEFADAPSKPSAFFKSIDSIMQDTGISKETINRCIKEYIHLRLFKCKQTGSYKTSNDKEKNAPNIYVLDNDKAEQEIEWAVEKLKQMYNVDTFGEFKKRKRKVK